jgi:tryptophanyl-tRNA synthetase
MPLKSAEGQRVTFLFYSWCLLQGQEKMSKSDPNSAIFMEDSEGDVNVKIKKAFCPPQVI